MKFSVYSRIYSIAAFCHERYNEAETARRICAVYRSNALKKRIVQKWLVHFRDGSFDFKDAEQSGRPSAIDTDKITTLLNAHPHLKIDVIGDILGVPHGSVVTHLEKAGYMSAAST